MKTNRSKQSRTGGSVLLVTMCVLGVAAIAIASYLMMVQNQTSSVARSQTWNSIVPISEAGVEEGLALVNQGVPDINTGSPWAWTTSVTSNGWSAFSGGQISLTRYVSGSNYYTVTVDTNSGTPTITSTAVVPYTSVPWIFSSTQQPFVAAIGLQPFLAQSTQGSLTGNLGRKVQVQTVLNALFPVAIITKSNFDMNGNNTTVDSFDSSTSVYSTGGLWDQTKRKAGGSVATDSSIVGGISVGNGNIYGHVYTGGTSQSAVQIGPNGKSGDLAWNATQTGIEPGFWSGDFNVNIPDVNAPATGALTTLPAPSNGVVNLPPGSYTISPIDPNIGKPLNITGNTTLWVQGSYSPPGITIASIPGASLKLYVGRTSGSGDSTTLGGNGDVNAGGYAENLQFYGLPSLTSLAMHGNSAFTGTIYAPDADATFGGGGNNFDDTSGAIVVKSLTLGGHWNFHYDEDLATHGPNRGWIPKNWTEMKFP